MQIKLFTIPIVGGEALVEEMNRFIRSEKVLHIESNFIDSGKGVFWCFCIRYLENSPVIQYGSKRKGKIDYKAILDKESFERFVNLREIRKRIANEEAIPAYAIFTNEELAELAKIEALTISKMKKIKGIGERKVDKYAQFFITERPTDEKEKLSD